MGTKKLRQVIKDNPESLLFYNLQQFTFSEFLNDRTEEKVARHDAMWKSVFEKEAERLKKLK